jgi:hypothetical protein
MLTFERLHKKKDSERSKHQAKNTPICTSHETITGAPLYEQYSIWSLEATQNSKRETQNFEAQSRNKVCPTLAPDFLSLSLVLGAYQKLSNLDNNPLLI